jgi:DNA-binding HxlR family transcriptional regulator
MIEAMIKPYALPCPIAKTLDLVGDRWTLLVIRDLLFAERRFQELVRSLRGVAPNLLSARLKRLEEHGLAVRRPYSRHPPRVVYALTEKGRELGPVVGALAAWGTRHVHRKSGLLHADCETPVEVRYHCRACRRRVRPAALRMGRL